MPIVKTNRQFWIPSFILFSLSLRVVKAAGPNCGHPNTGEGKTTHLDSAQALPSVVGHLGRANYGEVKKEPCPSSIQTLGRALHSKLMEQVTPGKHTVKCRGWHSCLWHYSQLATRSAHPSSSSFVPWNQGLCFVLSAPHIVCSLWCIRRWCLEFPMWHSGNLSD